jgi:hypothetical protein
MPDLTVRLLTCPADRKKVMKQYCARQQPTIMLRNRIYGKNHFTELNFTLFGNYLFVAQKFCYSIIYNSFGKHSSTCNKNSARLSLTIWRIVVLTSLASSCFSACYGIIHTLNSTKISAIVWSHVTLHITLRTPALLLRFDIHIYLYLHYHALP